MPKKKKVKVKMTEEEKIIYEEQKRLAEEEMEKKKEEMLMQFFKDKLAKEEKYTQFNTNKINDRWRSMLREIKSKELKSDIIVLKNTFDRVVDQKDEVVKALVLDIKEAEEQYMMSLRSHLENADHLIGIHRQRLNGMEQEYSYWLDILRKEFEKEQALMIKQHFAEMNDLADILFAMEQNYNERESEAYMEFEVLKEDVKNRNLEEKHSLRVSLEAKVDNLWQQFKQALHNYNDTTEERKIAFENLKKKDEKSANEIERQMRKLQKLSETIHSLRGKISANARENEERNRLMKYEREKMKAQLRDFKRQMNSVRNADREKLTKLTIESNAAIKDLTKQRNKGVKILKLAERCRKQETEEEKVLPFYSSSLTQQELEDIRTAEMESTSEHLSSFSFEYTFMENFWKRYNKVYLDKVVLDKEKEILVEENQRLRFLLKQYLDGISVNEEVLSQINPLLVIKNRINANFRFPIAEPRVEKLPNEQTVQEAVVVMKKSL